jgi:hypothetical protein
LQANIIAKVLRIENFDKENLLNKLSRTYLCGYFYAQNSGYMLDGDVQKIKIYIECKPAN